MIGAQTPRLDRSLVSGIAWTALFRWGAQLISWVATFYAARILDPGDFGIVSMAGISIGLVRMIEGFGLDAILVQDRTIVGERQSRLAGLVLGLGLVLVAAFALLAPLVADLFREPAVRWVVVVMSLVLIFDALQVVPRATLQRDLEFRKLAIVMFVQFVTTAGVLVLSARAGLGYWALVLNTLGGATAATILLFIWAPYTVAWPRDLANLAKPILQGWRVLASRIAWYGYSSADQTIIGRVLGKGPLGAYSFAVTFSTLAQDEIGSIISKVVPGIFSEVQDQVTELKRYFLLLTEFLTVLSFPVSIGMALVADLLIPVALGPEWDAAIHPLQLLCLYSAFLSSQTLNSHVLLWTGQFRANMWCSILVLVTMPLVLFGAVQHGLVGVGLAWAVVFPVLNLPAFYYSFRTINLKTSEWLDSLKPASVGCLVMTGTVLGIRALLPGSVPLIARTAAAVITGAITYPATIWFLFPARVKQIVDVARSVRSAEPAAAIVELPLDKSDEDD